MSKKDLITVKEASELFNTNTSNIRYLLEYQSDIIHRYNSNGNKYVKSSVNNDLRVSLSELKSYYENRRIQNEDQLNEIGATNSELDFQHLSDSQRTTHVHGLHPYMGKFIPQLAEHFLKKHFSKNNVILDPFGGSGTTLIEANILGMDSIGIDIAKFNTIMMNAKLTNYNIDLMEFEVLHILNRISLFSLKNWNDKDSQKGIMKVSKIDHFRKRLIPESKQTVLDEFFEHEYDVEKVQNLFNNIDEDVPKSKEIDEPKSEYLKSWLAPRTNAEVNYYASLIPNYHYQDLLKVILSASIRSSRLIKHIDLTRPSKPLKPDEEYVCKKHLNRICKPINQALKWLRYRSIGKIGVINRITEFNKYKTKSQNYVFHGDSTNINLVDKLGDLKSPLISNMSNDKFIDGVFTSPPYVGLIDYHDQHRYAYEILNLPFQSDSEIGSAQLGTSEKAKKEYQRLIGKVLTNIKPFLKEKANLFIVANDRHKLYSQIFSDSGYTLMNTDIRGVYKRADSGGAKANYQESIFQIQPS